MSQKIINGGKDMSMFRGVLFSKIDPVITEWMSRNGYLLGKNIHWDSICLVWVSKVFPGIKSCARFSNQNYYTYEFWPNT